MVVGSSKDIAMTLPVTVDPRYHDAVIFNLDAVLTDTDGVPVLVHHNTLAPKIPRHNSYTPQGFSSYFATADLLVSIP
jgi:hypothetical protein